MSDEKNVAIRLDIGCGRMKSDGCIGIDKTQCIDGNGTKIVDIVLDMEKDDLPYADGTVSEVYANSFLEHVDNLLHVMNECWRVLEPGGIFRGSVPVCGTDSHWKDPTHRRCFVKDTFSYFSGKSLWKEGSPSHPKYADYGFLAWDMLELKQIGDILYFKMKPQK